MRTCTYMYMHIPEYIGLWLKTRKSTLVKARNVTNQCYSLFSVEHDVSKNAQHLKIAVLQYFFWFSIHSQHDVFRYRSDGHLVGFIEGLGPGQTVGRQVLGSPCLGEIQLSFARSQHGQLSVEVVRARGLQAKPGCKMLPGECRGRRGASGCSFTCQLEL